MDPYQLHSACDPWRSKIMWIL